jgi:hypothetical protein
LSRIKDELLRRRELPSIAVGIPHAAHRPERADSMKRVREALGPLAHEYGEKHEYREFTEREPHEDWSRRMWRWGAESGCSHFLTLQDDVIIAPFAIRAIQAMCEAKPDEVLGLAAVHPLGPELARQGNRWYRSKGWLPGWGYVIPTDLLRRFLPWADEHLEQLRDGTWGGEDFFFGHWLTEQGRDVHHPIPTVVDHDTSLESTSTQGDHTLHPHRHATVTWRAYSEEDLASPDYWRAHGPEVPVIGAKMCAGCGAEPETLRLRSGLTVGVRCASEIGITVLGMVRKSAVGS